MAFKLNRNHSDYLLWIFPLLILGLIIFTVKRDNNNKESGNSFSASFDTDSLITMRIPDKVVDSYKTTNSSDSTQIFYVSSEEDY